MYKDDMISIIIPVYNVASFLDRCLATIVNQTYTNLEILLVDDGSTDGSDDKCDVWASRDKRIRVIHKPNGGAASARNTGLDQATGEFIMFADADDYLSENECRVLLEALNSSEADCSVSGFVMVDENEQLGQEIVCKQPVTVSGIQAICKRYIENDLTINIIEPWGKLFRRDLWIERRFTDGIYYEDLDIMPYLYCDCERVVFVPYVGYYYYQRSDSASHAGGTDDKRYTDSVLIRQKHIRYYQRIGQNELAVEMARRLIDLIITSGCNGWIPRSAQKQSKEIFSECIDIIKCEKALSFKDKARYTIYRYLGAKTYRKLVLRT